VSHGFEWNVSVRAAAGLEADLDVADRIEAAAVFRRKLNYQRELALALQNRRRLCPLVRIVFNGLLASPL